MHDVLLLNAQYASAVQENVAGLTSQQLQELASTCSHTLPDSVTVNRLRMILDANVKNHPASLNMLKERRAALQAELEDLDRSIGSLHTLLESGAIPRAQAELTQLQIQFGDSDQPLPIKQSPLNNDRQARIPSTPPLPPPPPPPPPQQQQLRQRELDRQQNERPVMQQLFEKEGTEKAERGQLELENAHRRMREIAERKEAERQGQIEEEKKHQREEVLARKMKEEAIVDQRKALEQQRLRDEETKKQQEEAAAIAAARKMQQEEALKRQQEEERKRQQEEALKRQKEEQLKQQELLRQQDEQRKLEEIQRAQEEERLRQVALRAQEEERRRKEEEMRVQEEERKRQELLRQQEEERQKYEEMQRIRDEEWRMQELLRQQEEERKREEILRAQEEERRKQEMQRAQEEERHRQELVRKQEEERHRQEERHREQEKRHHDFMRKRQEELEEEQRRVLAQQELLNKFERMHGTDGLLLTPGQAPYPQTVPESSTDGNVDAISPQGNSIGVVAVHPSAPHQPSHAPKSSASATKGVGSTEGTTSPSLSRKPPIAEATHVDERGPAPEPPFANHTAHEHTHFLSNELEVAQPGSKLRFTFPFQAPDGGASFAANEEVVLIEKTDINWWTVMGSNGVQELCPVNYMVLIGNAPTATANHDNLAREVVGATASAISSAGVALPPSEADTLPPPAPPESLATETAAVAPANFPPPSSPSVLSPVPVGTAALPALVGITLLHVTHV